MKDIPILVQHDHSQKPIGRVLATDRGLSVQFREDVRITREMLFDIFGGAGIRVDEMERDGDLLIVKAGTILEFSSQCASLSIQP